MNTRSVIVFAAIIGTMLVSAQRGPGGYDFYGADSTCQSVVNHFQVTIGMCVWDNDPAAHTNASFVFEGCDAQGAHIRVHNGMQCLGTSNHYALTSGACMEMEDGGSEVGYYAIDCGNGNVHEKKMPTKRIV